MTMLEDHAYRLIPVISRSLGKIAHPFISLDVIEKGKMLLNVRSIESVKEGQDGITIIRKIDGEEWKVSTPYKAIEDQLAK